MSDESEAAWRKHMRPGVLYGENQRQGFCAGFDAGRASRDADLEDFSRTLDMQSKILRATANALKGDPGPLTWHSHHDLAEVAAELLSRAEAAEAVIAAAVTIIRRDQDRLVNLDPTELLVALHALAVSHPEPTEEAK